MILCRRVFGCIFLDTSSDDVLQLHHIVEFFPVDSVRIVDVSVGIGKGHDFGSKLEGLLCCILCHVSRTRDADGLSFETVAFGGEHG